MSHKSTDVRGIAPGETNYVNVDGFGVDYSFIPETDPERTVALVTVYVKQTRKLLGPERINTLIATLTPDTAEELAHALIVQAANARANRDELAANRPVVREVAS